MPFFVHKYFKMRSTWHWMKIWSSFKHRLSRSCHHLGSTVKSKCQLKIFSILQLVWLIAPNMTHWAKKASFRSQIFQNEVKLAQIKLETWADQVKPPFGSYWVLSDQNLAQGSVIFYQYPVCCEADTMVKRKT